MKPELKKVYLDENGLPKGKFLTDGGQLHRRALRHSISSRLGRKQSRKKRGAQNASSTLKNVIQMILHEQHKSFVASLSQPEAIATA